MQFVTIAGRRYARFERLGREAGLIHAFSTRPDDVSPRTGDREVGRAGRRRRMALDLGLKPEWVCYCEQVHGERVAVLKQQPLEGRLEGFDAVVTALPGVPVMTFSADCPLILAYDPVRRVLGLVHASWRCSVAGMGRRVVEVMRGEFGCAAADVLAGIGPGAGPCCYEVGADVFEAAGGLPDHETLFERRGGRLYFDLWQASRVQLAAGGLRMENIETAGICTLCRNDLFYSFRREGAGCGHFGLMAALATG